MLMSMMANVLLCLAFCFMLAISCHRRSGPLQRQNNQKEDNQLAHAEDANSARACRTTTTEAVSAKVAITPATNRSGQAVPVPNTPKAAMATATLPMASLRLHSS